jgi:NAD(P)-dependent dehydrogenase (short-subunit alcohol dehydrogenase family)
MKSRSSPEAPGIGQAIAARLRKDGLAVATIDLKPAENDESSFVADVTDRAQVDDALAAIRRGSGPSAVLVDAAGIDLSKSFTDISFDAGPAGRSATRSGAGARGDEGNAAHNGRSRHHDSVRQVHPSLA